MIPHTRKPLPCPPGSRPDYLCSSTCSGSLCFQKSFGKNEPGCLAELSPNESRDPTTEALCGLFRFRLREHPDDRLRAGGPHEHTGRVAEPVGDPRNLVEEARRQVTAADRDVFLCLREAGHDGRELRERAALVADRAAE